MRAAGIDRFGAAVRSMTLPNPRALAPDEVLIRVMAAGVGNWDDFARVGDWDLGRTWPRPASAGRDARARRRWRLADALSGSKRFVRSSQRRITSPASMQVSGPADACT
jgi:hypothetical protein